MQSYDINVKMSKQEQYEIVISLKRKGVMTNNKTIDVIGGRFLNQLYLDGWVDLKPIIDMINEYNNRKSGIITTSTYKLRQTLTKNGN